MFRSRKQKENNYDSRVKSKTKGKQEYSQSKSIEDIFKQKSYQSPFKIIDSPSLNSKLSQLNSTFKDTYTSAFSTPARRINDNGQRRKYTNIKLKIVQAFKSIETEKLSMEKFFSFRQILLSQFLQEFTQSIEVECREKGEILRFIWNSMFGMLSLISDRLGNQMIIQQRIRLENTIADHKIYQEMIENGKVRQQALKQKSRLEKTTIHTLINELRVKRKQINRLYRAQRLLINEINEVKHQSLNLQGSYIDLMSTIKDLSRQQAQKLVVARQQLNQNRHKKVAVSSKKQNKKVVINQISKNQDLQQLCQQLKQIAINQIHSPQILPVLTQAAIQNFGIKYDDQKQKSVKLMTVTQKLASISAETQIEPWEFIWGKRQIGIQNSYFQKLNYDLVNNRMVQTNAEVKKKLMFNTESQTEEDVIRVKQLKKRLACFKVYQLELWMRDDKNKENQTKNLTNKTHKKHISESKVYESIFKADDQDSQTDINPQIKITSSEASDELLGRVIRKQKRNTNTVALSNLKKRQQIRLEMNRKVSNDFLRKKKDVRKVRQKNVQSDEQIQKSQIPQTSLIPRQSSTFKKSKFYPDRPQLQRQSQTNEQTSVETGQSPLNQTLSKLGHEVRQNNFLDKDAQINIEMTQQKQKFIANHFLKKIDYQFEVEDIDEDQIPKKKKNKREISEKRNSRQAGKYQDQNEILLNMCRNNYRRSRKMKDRISIIKYRNEFTCVKDNILIIAKDVNELLHSKSINLRNAINNKSLKSTYKILMMTFTKAYDYYNRGVVISSLAYPLFQSFALVYGAISSTQIYKKMVNFISCLALNTQNTILRFFLFFLGLDNSSPYSPKVTISEVYLCLKLLQKISIGKVTLNIESIYTDTQKIKSQLTSILDEQKIPRQLSINVQRRVVTQLQRVGRLQGENSEMQINIYNIIILIIQQVLKCKHSLKQSFIPIFRLFDSYQNNKVPLVLLEIVLYFWSNGSQNNQTLIKMLKQKTQALSVTIEQFCSILFQNNLMHFNQLYQTIFHSRFVAPDYYFDYMAKSSIGQADTLENKLTRFAISLVKKEQPKEKVQNMSQVDKMHAIIFWKLGEIKAERLTKQILGQYFNDWF